MRQKLQHEDYKVNRGFAVACGNDIRARECTPQSQVSKEVGMATILLCLEKDVQGIVVMALELFCNVDHIHV